MTPAIQLIVIGDNTTKDYLTPWMPTPADNAFFTYEIVHQYFDTGSFSVTAYTKNRDDAGSEGTSFTSFSQIGSTGLYQKQCTNLKELVRYKISIVAHDTEPARTEGVTLRFLPPTWYSTATS